MKRRVARGFKFQTKTIGYARVALLQGIETTYKVLVIYGKSTMSVDTNQLPEAEAVYRFLISLNHQQLCRLVMYCKDKNGNVN